MGGIRFDTIQLARHTARLSNLPHNRRSISTMDFRRISCGKRSKNDKVISGEMVTTESKYRVHVFVPRRQDKFR
jgi:hypothetical protein